MSDRQLPKDALASDWDEYWKDSEPVKRWFSGQVQSILENMSFGNGISGKIIINCRANTKESSGFYKIYSSGLYDIDAVLGLDDLGKPTKDRLIELGRLKKHLVDSIRKIDAYAASYVPRKNVKPVERPRYRVKAVCRKIEGQPTI